jgi:hypothetical protein
MTTTQVEQSLTARAVDYFAECVRQTAEADAVRDRERHAYARAEFVKDLAEALSVHVRAEDVSIDRFGYCRATVEGLTFSFQRCNEYPTDDEYAEPRVVVLRTCDKGCGIDLWMNAEGLFSLGESLASDEFRHQWDCKGERPPSVPKEERAIDDVLAAAEVYAQAVTLILELEDGRAAEKSAAIRRLMQTENDETGKQHSASSAEKIVETDGEYAAYRKRQRDAEVEKHRAEAALFAAKQRARLAVDAVRAGNDA